MRWGYTIGKREREADCVVEMEEPVAAEDERFDVGAHPGLVLAIHVGRDVLDMVADTPGDLGSHLGSKDGLVEARLGCQAARTCDALPIEREFESADLHDDVHDPTVTGVSSSDHAEVLDNV